MQIPINKAIPAAIKPTDKDTLNRGLIRQANLFQYRQFRDNGLP